ncbi:MAG: metallophosphoesterase family protein [Acutalibacteraceae bacterium]
MRKCRRFLWIICCCLLLGMTACGTPPDENSPAQKESVEKEESTLSKSGPHMEMTVTKFELTDTITVSFQDTDSKDWIGIYQSGVTPGTTSALVWKYAEGSDTLLFHVDALQGAGDYTVYLCDNDGYAVLDSINITVLDSDTTDYGAKDAAVNAAVISGKSEITVTVTPSSAQALTYTVYWSRQNDRLGGYLPLSTVEHTGETPFEIKLNDCLFMPDDADGIEICVKKGRSTPLYVPMTEELKLPASKKLYEFQVISDLHINGEKPQHTAHLTAALEEIAAVSPASKAIFCVGDNTDRGVQENYDLLAQTISSVNGTLPPIYYAIGNHDMIYGTNYDKQVALFTDNLGMPSVYYAGDIGDTRYIVLGSDSIVGEGTIGEKQLAFLKKELAKVERDKPVFIFLHQPLIDTVSGSLYSRDPDIQYWYGIIPTGDQVRAVLKNYPNAILFTGHTHWSFEMYQPLLFGEGVDATFANTASVGYLWSDEDKAISGSEGYYVEVYEDYVLLKGREYTEGNWCAAAQFKIPLSH